MNFDLTLLLRPGPELIAGFGVTIAVTFAAFSLASILGTVLALSSLSSDRTVQRSVAGLTYLTRTTPELIAIFWAYYCLPQLIGLQLSGFTCGVLALGLIGGGYMAEIIRGGILAVPSGQWEAARTLGLPPPITWFLVIFPQALRQMLPAVVNYFTDVLKNSTLLAGIGVGEIAYAAYMAGSASYRYIEPLTGVALIFFAFVFPLSLLARRLGARQSANTQSL